MTLPMPMPGPLPGGILRIGILQWPKDQVDNIFLAPIIRNASDELRSTVVTPLVVVHDQMPLSKFMRWINIELCFCIVLRTVVRADRFYSAKVADVSVF